MYNTREIRGTGIAFENDLKFAKIRYICRIAEGVAGSSADGEFQLEDNQLDITVHNSNTIETALGNRFSIFVTEVSGSKIRFVVSGLIPDDH